MKLYHFNPNNYGDTFSVMAESKEDALIALEMWFKEEIARDGDHSGYWENEFKIWSEATPKNLPLSYTLEEYSVGDVIRVPIQ